MSITQLTLRQTTDALTLQIETKEARLEAEQQKLEADREEFSGKRQKLETDRAHMEDVYAKASETLVKERQNFEAEKAKVFAENIKAKTKIKLDVGGTGYSTSRTTLTSLPGSMLEAMFSGRHVLEEDESGRIFIDRNGATFEFVLEYLRSPGAFSLEGLSKREVAATITEFGFFGLPSPLPPDPPFSLQMTTRANSGSTAVVDESTGTCLISRAQGTGTGRSSWAVGSYFPPGVVFWKMTVNSFVEPDDVMCGIIANPSPGDITYTDATFCGWSEADIVYIRGDCNAAAADGWPGWQAGDEGIFKLDATAGSLKVRLRRTGRIYIIIGLPSPAESWRTCVLPYQAGSSLSVSTVSDEERALVG
mmetsp:Transcript_61916/g.121607  ORF Transcript_61916/g.121607 Transcript_61916/m.121607 type:complete len:364 (+) Transcript_61916:247-1338(+)